MSYTRNIRELASLPSTFSAIHFTPDNGFDQGVEDLVPLAQSIFEHITTCSSPLFENESLSHQKEDEDQE
jgi:hypothetical protein